MSFYFPVERELTNNDLEAYAHGCYDILKKLGIFDEHCKVYDPLTIENNYFMTMALGYGVKAYCDTTVVCKHYKPIMW